MRNASKLVLLFMAVALVVGASPIPQLSGTWAGKGKGNCHPPGTTIYPWQHWKGIVTDDGQTFYGEWYDEKGNHGEFKGKIDYIGIMTAVCKGKWTWDDPSAVSIVAGEFKMTFYVFTGKCKGTWNSIYPSTSAYGTMEGEKVD